MHKMPALIYKLYFLAIFVVYLLSFAIYHTISPSLSWGFSTVVSPAIELGFFCMFGLYLSRVRRPWLRIPALIISLLIPLCLALVYLSQGYSAFVSGSYITVLALENAGETQYINGSGILVTGFLLLISWLCLVGLVLRHAIWRPAAHIWRIRWTGAVALSVLFAGVLDGKTRVDDLVFITPEVVPATSLLRRFNDLYAFRRASAQEFAAATALPDFLTVDLDVAYPLQRQQRTFAPLSFTTKERTKDNLNLIVIFAEGLSARALETYGGMYSDLTPNLNSFAQSAMVVENYYNHTAATFRGLLGQLSSGYPVYGGNVVGGWEEPGKDNTDDLTSIGYQTLPNILLAHDYETVFFSPHPNSNPLNSMLRALDFQTVHSLETMTNHLERPLDPLGEPKQAVQDRDIFAGLQKLLENRIAQGQDEPFFAATYNIGTHAFLDSPENAARYRDGKNSALNRFHEFDVAIGPFLDYFRGSAYAENTVLVITADHSAFPEPPIVEAFNAPDFHQVFVDEIPMIIHAPHFALPLRFDANYENSVDLAPSLLHLIGIDNFEHAFVGQSIFNKERQDGFSIASIGNQNFLINADGITEATTQQMADQYIPEFNLIRLHQVLEKENRLFNRD